MQGSAFGVEKHVLFFAGLQATESYMKIHRAQCLFPLLVLVFLFFVSVPSHAQLASNNVRFCPDVTSVFRLNQYTPRQIISAGPYAAGSLYSALSADLPPGVRLDALIVHSNLIVFSTDVSFFKGGTLYNDEDLVAYDVNSGAYSMYFDGTANGVPAGADLDAAALDPCGSTLYLSFDILVVLPGVGRVCDEDVVEFVGGVFTTVHRGSAVGIPPMADMDAFYLDEMRAYFSLDITATIGGFTATDEDVWVMDLTYSNILGVISNIGLEARADLVCLNCPWDSDGDWLTDFEEASGLDEPASTYPGSSVVLSPGGNRSDAFTWDTDHDGMGDGAEAACGTSPTNQADLLALIDAVPAGGTNLVVRWRSVPGKSYTLYSSVLLTNGFTNVVAAGYPAAASTNITTYTNYGVNLDDRLFYRVRLDTL